MRVVTPAGIPAQTWRTRLASEPSFDPVELLGLRPGGRVVVAGAHPDDETLGAGGILRRLARAGIHVTLVVATDGEAAYGADGPPPAQLAATRRHELGAALAALGVQPDVRWLGLPDGGLAGHEREITDALSAILRPATVVLATWLRDPHPDHAALGRAARAAARTSGCDLWWFPVWLRHRHEPTDDAVPWSQLRVVRLDDAEIAAKAAAVGAFHSQLIGPRADVGPVLPPSALAHFADGFELLVAAAPSARGLAAHFDAAHRGSPRWADADSWYEQRKRAVLLASLPAPTYECAWEPGASVGHLTAALATRCHRVVASDVSPVAVEAARTATAALDGVQFDVAQTPGQPPRLPDASCDLVVLAELLYYLEPGDRARTLELAARLLAPGGHLLAVHWRHLPDDAYCAGREANQQVVERFGGVLVHHDDTDFVLDVVTA